LIHPWASELPRRAKPRWPHTAWRRSSVLLVLKAFSAGCSALTGVEAIANGVPLFKEPRAARAKRTELLLGLILGAMLLGLAVLTNKFHVVPRSGETVLSQIMVDAVGRHWAYYFVSLVIILVLALAANTSFGGLPVLTSLLSRDGYLPHLFGVRDSRLVFGNGVWVLTVFSGILLVAVDGNTNTLIPLFAIGVFIGFTFPRPAWSCIGVARGSPDGVAGRRSRRRAMVTAVATIIFLFTKFVEGAWVVVVAIPLLILLFNRVNAYYARTVRQLGIGKVPGPPIRKRTVVVVPVTNVSRLTRLALSEGHIVG